LCYEIGQQPLRVHSDTESLDYISEGRMTAAVDSDLSTNSDIMVSMLEFLFISITQLRIIKVPHQIGHFYAKHCSTYQIPLGELPYGAY